MIGDRIENEMLMTICTATMAQSVTRHGAPMPESVVIAVSSIPIPIAAGDKDRSGQGSCQNRKDRGNRYFNPVCTTVRT